MTIVYILLLTTFSLFRAVSLPSLVYNSSTIAKPSTVVIVSHYIAKSIVLQLIPVYLYSYIEGFSTKVLSLKDYSILIYFLYSYYTIHI